MTLQTCIDGASPAPDSTDRWALLLEEHGPHMSPYHWVAAAANQAWALGQLGQPDDALRWSSRAVEVAREQVPERVNVLLIARVALLGVTGASVDPGLIEELCERLDGESMVATARLLTTSTRLEQGRHDEALDLLERYLAGPHRQRAPAFVFATAMTVASTALRVGALRVAARALWLAAETPHLASPWLASSIDRLRTLGGPAPVGRWLVDGRLGVGASGEVWAGGETAVKLVHLGEDDPEVARARVDAEVRAAAALRHPNVVPILDAGVVGAVAARLLDVPEHTPWVAMPRAVHSLSDVLDRLDWARTQEVLRAVLAGLAAAHARGLLHLDVKPDNVLLRRDDIWLADFGVAASVGVARHAAGSPSYMAPERFRGETLGVGADLYAVGCMAWTMVTGRPPYRGPPRAQQAQHLAGRLPAFVPRWPVPLGLRAWVEWLLAPRPEGRPASAPDAAAALVALGAPAVVGEERGDGVVAGAEATFGFELDHAPEETSPGALAASPNPPSAVHDPSWAPVAGRLPPWRSLLPPTPPSDGSVGLLEVRRMPFVGGEALRDELWGCLQQGVSASRGALLIVRAARLADAERAVAWLLEVAAMAPGVAIVDHAVCDPRAATTLYAVDPRGALAEGLAGLAEWLVAGWALVGVVAVQGTGAVPWPEGLRDRLYEVFVEAHAAADVAAAVETLLPMVHGLAGVLVQRLGAEPELVRRTLSAWVRQGKLVDQGPGYGPRWDIDVWNEPLEEASRGVGPGLTTDGRRVADALRHHGGMAEEADLTEVVASIGSDASAGLRELVRRGDVRRIGERWALRATSPVDEPDPSTPVRALHEAWLRVDPTSRHAPEHLRVLGRVDEAFEMLIRRARAACLGRRALELRSLLGRLGVAVDRLGLAPDDRRAIAVDVLEAYVRRPDLAAWDELDRRATAHGDPFDRGLTRLQGAKVLGTRDRVAYERRLERAMEEDSHHPGRLAAKGWSVSGVVRGASDASQRVARTVEVWHAAGHRCHADDLLAARAYVEGRLGDADAHLTDVLDHVTDDWPWLRSQAAMQRGQLALLRGERAVARGLFEDAVRSELTHGSSATPLLCLAELDLLDGRLERIGLVSRLRHHFVVRESWDHVLTVDLMMLVHDPPPLLRLADTLQRVAVKEAHLETVDAVIDIRRRRRQATDELEALAARLAAMVRASTPGPKGAR